MSSSRIEVAAPAKINLFLEVLHRRPDGYHELDSIFAALDLHDTVVLERADRVSLTAEGHEVPLDRTNLAWRAADALGVGARIHLVKRIPAGAGLGGGSSDAAAVLTGLDRLYGMGIARDRMVALARGLGADIPFFLTGGTARCRGIGDLVEPLEGGRGRRFCLLQPSIFVATERVYGALSGLTGRRKSASVFFRRYFGKPGRGRAPFYNRLQETAEALEPGLRAVREDAERRFGARFCLSGSGSSYFTEIDDMRAPPAPFEVGGISVRVHEVATI